MQRLYVGYVKDGSGYSMEVFRSDYVPTFATHGEQYYAVIGPFRTKRGADWMAKYPRSPICQTVSDAERLSK